MKNQNIQTTKKIRFSMFKNPLKKLNKYIPTSQDISKITKRIV